MNSRFPFDKHWTNAIGEMSHDEMCDFVKRVCIQYVICEHDLKKTQKELSDTSARLKEIIKSTNYK